MIELTTGILIAISILLILEPNSRRRVFGITLLGMALNLALLCSGRLNNHIPAFVNQGTATELSNSVPQALILTAIVIGLALLVVLCVLIKLKRAK